MCAFSCNPHLARARFEIKLSSLLTFEGNNNDNDNNDFNEYNNII